MKKHKFKPKEIKTRGVISGIKTICAICKQDAWGSIHKEETIKYFHNVAEEIHEHNENHPIKKLDKNIDSGYSITEKINEVISWINQHEK